MRRPPCIHFVAASAVILTVASADLSRGAEPSRRIETAIGTIQIGMVPSTPFRCPTAERSDVETNHKFWAAGQGTAGKDALFDIATSCPKKSCASDEERTVVAVRLSGSPYEGRAGRYRDCSAAPAMSLSTRKGLRIGDAASRVRELYGTPDKASFHNSKLIYRGRAARVPLDLRKGTIPYEFEVDLKDGRVDTISLIDNEEYEATP